MEFNKWDIVTNLATSNILTFIVTFFIIPVVLIIIYYKKYNEPFAGILLKENIDNEFNKFWYYKKIFRLKVFLPLILIIFSLAWHLNVINYNNNKLVLELDSSYASNMITNDSFELINKMNQINGTLDETKYVKAGVFLTNLYNISLIDHSFKATFWLWFDYKDSTISEMINTNAIDIFDATEIQKRMSATIPPQEQGGNYYSWIFYDATFIKDWNVINYPFDRHNIKIEFETAYDDARRLKLDLDSTNSTIDKSRTTYTEWRIKENSLQIKDGVNRYDSNFGDLSFGEKQSLYSSIKIILNIVRSDSLFLYFKLFTGLFTAFIICLMGLLITADSTARFSLHVAGIIAAITNKLNVDKIIPHYFGFTLSDYTHLIFFSGMLVIILISIFQLLQLREAQETFASGAIVKTSFARYHFHLGLFWCIIIFIYTFVMCLAIAISMAILDFKELTR